MDATDLIAGIGALANEPGDALFNFEAGTAFDRSFTVVSVRGHEAISKLFRFEVTVLLDADEDPSGELLQKPARMTFRSGDEAVRTVRGIVGAIEPTSARLFDGRRAWRFKLVPRMWLLKHRVTSRIFQDLSVPEIISTVLEGVGLAGNWKLLRTYPVRNYCVQYQESDYAFVKRLLAEEGIFYYFDQPGDLADALTGGSLVGAATNLANSALSGDVSSALGSLAAFTGVSETVVFADDPLSYAVISDGTAAPSVSVDLSVGLDGLSASASASLASARALTVRDHVTQSPSDDDVFRAGVRHAVKPERTLLRDYDFHRPLLELRSSAALKGTLGVSVGGLTVEADLGGSVGDAVGGAVGALGGAAAGDLAGAVTNTLANAVGLGGTELRTYHHRSEYEAPEVSKGRARTVLEQHRRKSITGTGTSSSRRLFPGARFRLESDSGSLLAGEYTLTAVEHEGHVPELSQQLAAVEGTEGVTQQSYANRFECVPAKVAFRPKRPKPVLRQVIESATVVGPAGEEIYTDSLGRIKVQFHWDLDGARNEQSSCWMRVLHSWGGAGWGTQFIPRIGMEVMVSFVYGDQDAPLVIGSVYNGTHPFPFNVPGDKTRSGIRTQSSLGGEGFNELSFEDAKNAEQVYLHAQRDLDEVVERDHTLRVGRDETMAIGRHQSLHVGGDQSERIDGSHRARIGVDHSARVDGNRETSVGQDETLRVEGNRYTVSTNDDQMVTENLTTRVGGRERREVVGTGDLVVKDDLTTRVNGNCTTVVGKHDAKRTYVVHAEGRAVLQSSDLTEIASEKELILRVGASRIRITEERIEFSGKAGLTLRSGNTVVQVTPEKARVRSKGKVVVSADSVNILTDGAQVKLSDEVKITGSKVKLNPPKTDTEKDDEPKPPEVTKIDLKDQEGRPLANQRFVIHLGDGSEIAGVLDHEGRSELEIEGSDAKITFPEVSEVKSG